jgi:hypothetical protein
VSSISPWANAQNGTRKHIQHSKKIPLISCDQNLFSNSKELTVKNEEFA